MSTSVRRKNTSVIKSLSEDPYRFNFLQAVRLLERSAVFKTEQDADIKYNRQPVARFTPPTAEVIRFKGNHSLSFSSSEITRINEKQLGSSKKWELSVNFMGLTGSQGVLPYHYTEMIQKRLKMKDKSLSEFLDLFNHRTLSLFYQASNKYKLAIEYERNKLNPPKVKKKDDFSQVLLSLIGLGTNQLDKRHYISDESLFYYSGLLSQQVKTASGLKQILRKHFNIPVEIHDFKGQWYDLIDDVKTRLPGFENPNGQNNCLGKTVMLGSKGWFTQGKINIILGPLDKSQFSLFSPGSNAIKSLNEITKIYLGLEHDYEFTFEVKKSVLPENIQLGKKSQSIIGWNTWLSNNRKTNNDSETVSIKVSAQSNT